MTVAATDSINSPLERETCLPPLLILKESTSPIIVLIAFIIITSAICKGLNSWKQEIFVRLQQIWAQTQQLSQYFCTFAKNFFLFVLLFVPFLALLFDYKCGWDIVLLLVHLATFLHFGGRDLLKSHMTKVLLQYPVLSPLLFYFRLVQLFSHWGLLGEFSHNPVPEVDCVPQVVTITIPVLPPAPEVATPPSKQEYVLPSIQDEIVKAIPLVCLQVSVMIVTAVIANCWWQKAVVRTREIVWTISGSYCVLLSSLALTAAVSIPLVCTGRRDGTFCLRWDDGLQFCQQFVIMCLEE